MFGRTVSLTAPLLTALPGQGSCVGSPSVTTAQQYVSVSGQVGLKSLLTNSGSTTRKRFQMFNKLAVCRLSLPHWCSNMRS